MKKRICIITAVAATLVLLSSCTQKSSADLFAMDTVMSMTVYGQNADSCLSDIQDRIKQLDGLFSVTDEQSEIYKINQSDTPVSVSSDTAKIISYAQNICQLTDGAFDITVRAVSKLWGFTDSDGRVPSQAEIDSALKLVGNDKLTLSADTVTCTGDIDLGGIAKGYTASCIREILARKNMKSAVISLGGNVLLYGKKPDGQMWSVGITHPKRTDDIIGILKAYDTAVVTSGGYERSFTVDGKTYQHILSPKTGYPVQGDVLSVSVITDDDTLADALSTALYVMDVGKAIDFWRARGDFDMILITDNTVYITENISDSFELSDSEYTLSKIEK